MDRLYAREYRELYERHWWWRAREDLILSVLDGRIAGRTPMPILDVGCGDGLFFEKLERYGPVEGIEMDPSGLDSRGRWAPRIRVGPFDETFEPGKTYGLVLMLDVLEHLPDPDAALRRALSLLRSDGTLLLTVPAFRMLWTSHDTLNHHYTRYSRGQLRKMVERAGGNVADARYFFLWTVPVKFAVRAKEALLGATPRVPTIPREWINRILYRLSRAEQRVLSRLPAPMGTSLIAVVRHSLYDVHKGSG